MYCIKIRGGIYSKIKKINQTQEKYIDDMTQCVAIDLKKDSVKDPNTTSNLPKLYHQRTGHIFQDKKTYSISSRASKGICC